MTKWERASVKSIRGSLTTFFCLLFVFNMAANFVHPVTPSIIVELGLNDYMFGLALAAQMALNFLFSPLWGKLAGQLGSRRVILINALGYALGQVFFALARTEAELLLARMFAGIFCGGVYVAFMTYTVNCSEEAHLGRNLTLNATVQAVSASFGYFVGGMVGEIDIYLSVWLQVATLAGIGTLMFLTAREDRPAARSTLTGREWLRACNPFSAFLQCRRFMTRALALVFLGYGLGNLGYIAFEQCFNFCLRDQFGLTSGYNGVIKAALGAISLLANSTLCLWILRRRSAMPWLAGVMCVCTAAMAGVLLSDGLIPFVITNVIFFAFYFVSVPLMQNRAAVLGAGPDSNLVMGAFNAVKSFGSIFGSALAGFMYEAHVKLPFGFGLIAFALAALTALLACKAPAKEEKHA